MTQTKSIFQRPLWVTIFALTAALHGAGLIP